MEQQKNTVDTQKACVRFCSDRRRFTKYDCLSGRADGFCHQYGVVGDDGSDFSGDLFKNILHTSISVKQIIGFGIALLGVLIIISKGRLNDLLHIPVVPGDFWMLFMTVIFGAYGVLQTRKTDVPALTLLGAMVFIGVLILTPVFLITLWTDPVRHLTTEAVVIVIYMGLCPSIISYLCWDISLEKSGR